MLKTPTRPASVNRTHIVGIGGGTGLSILLAGLKRQLARAGRDPRIPPAEISAIVSVADDGGSSGLLRESFDIPAVGDLRNCIVALAQGNQMWSRLFQHRFEGDNGLSGLTRPAPFGIDMENSNAYYWFVLSITAVVLLVVGRLVNSPFGASLRGTRDQARRMSSLGYNVWAIRWCAFVGASFVGAVAGLLYVYFHKYVHPSVLSVTASAEVLLSVIAGGAGTLAGPAVGAVLVVLLKNYASGYIELWNMLLGAVFVFIVLVMPHGIVPGVRTLLARLKEKRA